MAPDLLAMVQMQGFQRLLHCLVAGEAGPFMVAGGSSYRRQIEIGVRLMQPVGGAVHRLRWLGSFWCAAATVVRQWQAARLWGMAPQERRSAGSDAAGLADWLEQTLLHAGVITTCHLLAGG